MIAACLLPALSFGFLDWDDDIHVTRNPLVVAPDSVSLRDKLTTPALGYPIPVTVATYAWELRWLGQAPWHFHLLNVGLHLASCVLVFLLAQRVQLSLLGALCAVLLFGLHPVVAEPVSWVSGRKDLLATCLGLGMVLLAWPTANAKRQAGALACYAIGLLSKPTIAPLCLLVAIAHMLFGQQRTASTLRDRALDGLRVLWPYLVVLAPIALMGVLGQRAIGAISDPERAGASFVRAAWYALGHHVRLLLGLEEPTAKYLPVPWPPPFTPSVDLLLPLVVLLTWLTLRRVPATQRRSCSYGLWWTGLTYLPNSNIIPLARYLADSYVYLPLVGAALSAGALVDALGARYTRAMPVLRFAVPVLLMLLCAPGFMRSQQRWANDQTLWQHALLRYPTNPRLCRMWANGVANVRGPEPGLRATDKCLDAFGAELFAKNKGVLLGRLGRFDEARTWLERARQLRPEDAGIRQALANLPAQR